MDERLPKDRKMSQASCPRCGNLVVVPGSHQCFSFERKAPRQVGEIRVGDHVTDGIREGRVSWINPNLMVEVKGPDASWWTPLEGLQLIEG